MIVLFFSLADTYTFAVVFGLMFSLLECPVLLALNLASDLSLLRFRFICYLLTLELFKDVLSLVRGDGDFVLIAIFGLAVLGFG